MRTMFFFTFLLTIAKAGIWISLGILLKNHFETLLSLIIRKPIPNELIDKAQHESTIRVIKWVGIFFIILGIAIALMGLASMGMTSMIPHQNFNFKF